MWSAENGGRGQISTRECSRMRAMSVSNIADGVVEVSTVMNRMFGTGLSGSGKRDADVTGPFIGRGPSKHSTVNAESDVLCGLIKGTGSGMLVLSWWAPRIITTRSPFKRALQAN